jgi:hypothetical protein
VQTLIVAALLFLGALSLVAGAFLAGLICLSRYARAQARKEMELRRSLGRE